MNRASLKQMIKDNIFRDKLNIKPKWSIEDVLKHIDQESSKEVQKRIKEIELHALIESAQDLT